MAIEPGLYNFTLQRASDWSLDLELKDGDSDPINLSGYTVSSQIWDEDRVKKYADISIAYTDRANGIIDMNLTDTATATFTPNVLKYDVLLTEPGGSKNYYLEGTLFVSEGYTA